MKKSVHQANHSNSPVASLISYAQKQRKEEILYNMVPAKLRNYHEERTIHLHDLEYFDLTYNCIGVSVQDLVGENYMNFRQMLREDLPDGHRRIHIPEIAQQVDFLLCGDLHARQQSAVRYGVKAPEK